jgi:predicted Zn-dependent protease
MNPLPWPDKKHIQPAEGWLGLGNAHEANEELERIAPERRSHPAVFELRWQIYAQAKKWPACLDIATAITKLAPESPVGWIHLSYTLHEIHRTQEAWDNLTAVAAKFPRNYTIQYNLACYACQLGHIARARELLHRAFTLDSSPATKLAALNDPDLTPLWTESQRA